MVAGLSCARPVRLRRDGVDGEWDDGGTWWQTIPFYDNVTLNGLTKILSRPPISSEGSHGGRRNHYPSSLSSSTTKRCFTDLVSSIALPGQPVQQPALSGVEG